MKLGINFLLWTVHVDEQHFPLFNKLKSVGYDGVEIPLCFGELEHYENLGQVAFTKKATVVRGGVDGSPLP